MKKRVSANNSYIKARKDTEDLLEELRLVIEKLDREQCQNENSWALVGDINHINSELDDILCGYRKKGGKQ